MKAAGQEQERVLIVDDVVANIKSLIAILADDYRISFATDGRQALEVAASQPIDLILLDIVMPGMDGYEICKRLKADVRTRECPVIFITGLDDPHSEQRGLELGAVDYVTKPFSPAVVRARVKNHLTLRHTLNQLQRQNRLLQEAEGLRKQMELMARHDMKSPLDGIIGFANLLLQAEDIPFHHKAELKLIRQEGYRAIHMINLSLGLLQMEQGTYVLAPKVVDLVTILQEIRAGFSFLINTRRILFEILAGNRPVAAGERFTVWGEDLLCYSILANLVKNALEASPPGGRVIASLNKESAMNAVEISNQGAIPDPIREWLFEKYVTHGKKAGTGLGLYSARLITRTQGGTLQLEQGEEDETVFCVRLPKVVEPVAAVR
ncbi:MAG: hybrid sensor histidine kinase/response regulator [Magnetococcus sp. DMHC-8]